MPTTDKAPKSYVRIGASTRLATRHAQPATGRVFRDAWAWPVGRGAISIDMDRARDIVRERIRGEREERWQAADAAFNRALESGASTAEEAAARQALRDAPAHRSIADALTPAALAAITLDKILSA